MKKTLEEKLNKTIDMRLSVDEELIAGIRVKINDTLIDNSALSRLERMHREIVSK